MSSVTIARRLPEGRRAAIATAALPVACGAAEAGASAQSSNLTAAVIFLAFVAITLAITAWAARYTRTRREFYAAGGHIPAWQNGVALAGDFLSAATFLGITSALYVNGLDAITLLVGTLVGWPLILFLIAERLRNLGSYTFIDVVSFRLAARPIRIAASLSSLSVVIFYLIGQLVGAGKLIELLFGFEYVYAIVGVSLLMVVYVGFGGMLATTWVQFIKAVLLVAGGTILAALLLAHFDFDLARLFAEAVDTHPRGAALVAPGGWLGEPLSTVSVGLTLLLGFIGLPHILMRMFTVGSAREARKSAFYAIAIIGYVNLSIILLGFGAVSIIMFNPDYHDASGAMVGGYNMVMLHLTHFLGGDWLLGFISAVTFATILAVVSGLTLAGAATIAHDLYAHTIARGVVSSDREVLISRISVLALGVLGIVLGIAYEHHNIVFVATMALAVSGSANAPVLIVSMYWQGMTTRGAVAGIVTGLTLSVALIVAGPQVMVEIFGAERPWFPYVYPTVVSAPLAFLAIWLGSVTDRSRRAEAERRTYDAQYVRAETGLGLAAATAD
jgi:cation/acetate symporter